MFKLMVSTFKVIEYWTIFSKKFKKIKTKIFTKKIALVLGIIGIFLMSGFLGGDSIIFRSKVWEILIFE